MEIRIPEVGESVREALLAQWFKKPGDMIAKDEPLCEIETDKITLDINADCSGTLSILVPAGETVAIGTVIGTIVETGTGADTKGAAPPPLPAADVVQTQPDAVRVDEAAILPTVSSPSVRQEMRAQQIDPATITPSGKGGRITLDDLFSRIEQKARRPSDETPETPPATSPTPPVAGHQTAPQLASATMPEPSLVAAATTPPAAKTTSPATPLTPPQFKSSVPLPADQREVRIPLSPIRKRIAERLVAARQQTAMLTTFNEADLSQVKALREKYREHFIQRHGAALGLMPFFVKACCAALQQFPLVNASIDGDQLVYHHYYDIGIAIGAEKGLVVPVLRNADSLRLYEIDRSIAVMGEKIKSNQLSISDLEGGTFTITNGGVYGSMLSTPILNPPQSAVLGMHAIQERAVVRNGEIVIRPMMYLALSYDHRIIDGREAVNFLKTVKEYIEQPEELLLEG